MKNIIVGTAGHIDHGKTALVKALSGIDADRLPEEKRRGITIDLGFAHLELTPDIRVGFVDVPGHERFVRNMLAGVAGIDLVLLVIAADESIKPQTREHFDICRLLDLRRGIIVITKSDLVDPDLLDLVQLEAEELVAGSFLEAAPIVRASTVTGAGLAEIKSLLKSYANSVAERDRKLPARLPIDRSFSVRGFGTVVTGTLVSGSVARDSELDLLPSGRVVRVRGVETYGLPTNRASVGTRTALNLSDVEHGHIRRGMVLAERERFEATTVADCHIQLLPSAPRLKNRAPVHFHAGTSEVEAHIRLFGKAALEPGGEAFARIHLTEPAVLAPGDRFILRRFSPVITIAGGLVLDIRPVRERRVARIEARLRVLEADDPLAKVTLIIQESGSGISLADLARRLGIHPAQALVWATQAEAIVVEDYSWTVGRAWMEACRTDLMKLVKQHHAREPLSRGLPKQDAKSRLFADSPGFLFEALLAKTPELAVDGETIRDRKHRVVLTTDEQAARETIAVAFEKAGLAVPSVGEVLVQTGMDRHRGETLLRMLLKEGTLIRVSGELVFHQAAIQNLKAALTQKRSESFTVSTFKEWTGISRKYAVPLLEFLDREHVTVRKGDLRSVL